MGSIPVSVARIASGDVLDGPIGWDRLPD